MIVDPWWWMTMAEVYCLTVRGRSCGITNRSVRVFRMDCVCGAVGIGPLHWNTSRLGLELGQSRFDARKIKGPKLSPIVKKIDNRLIKMEPIFANLSSIRPPLLYGPLHLPTYVPTTTFSSPSYPPTYVPTYLLCARAGTAKIKRWEHLSHWFLYFVRTVGDRQMTVEAEFASIRHQSTSSRKQPVIPENLR